MKGWMLMISCMSIFLEGFSQDASVLINKVKAKIEQVNDYRASGVMKTNVPFLKVPVSEIVVYFKKPGKLKIKNQQGISLVPKGAKSISLSNLMSGRNFTAIPSGKATIKGLPVTVVKLLPTDDTEDIVLSTLYIDESKLLIVRAVTTTRENGTYELDMEYGRFGNYALPDQVHFTFNIKEYKLPKGVTFDYDDGSDKKKANPQENNNKGKLEITYSNYVINKGVPDSAFN
ncbi:MAG: hypothetical protein WKF97_09615 [Chitinophagaceae bacterium]